MTHRCCHHNPSPVNTDLSAGVHVAVEEEGSGLGEGQTMTAEDVACMRPLKMSSPHLKNMYEGS